MAVIAGGLACGNPSLRISWVVGELTISNHTWVSPASIDRLVGRDLIARRHALTAFRRYGSGIRPRTLKHGTRPGPFRSFDTQREVLRPSSSNSSQALKHLPNIGCSHPRRVFRVPWCQVYRDFLDGKSRCPGCENELGCPQIPRLLRHRRKGASEISVDDECSLRIADSKVEDCITNQPEPSAQHIPASPALNSGSGMPLGPDCNRGLFAQE